jgi:hypothetical protein
MIGNKNITCTSTGDWNGKPPSCAASSPHNDSCPPLTLSDHVKPSSTDTAINTVISFTCEDGYNMIGNKNITCTSTGDWNGKPPSCAASSPHNDSCPPLTLSDHVKPSSTDTAINTVISFTCEDGYNMIGNKNITCTSTGDWNGKPPSCATTSSSHSGKKSNVGAIAGGVVGGILVIVLIILATGALFWKLSSRYSKTGYSNVRLRMDEDRVELFPADDEADEPLYSGDPTEDDDPLDLTK